MNEILLGLIFLTVLIAVNVFISGLKNHTRLYVRFVFAVIFLSLLIVSKEMKLAFLITTAFLITCTICKDVFLLKAHS